MSSGITPTTPGPDPEPDLGPDPEPCITLAGLLFETAAGLRRSLEPSLACLAGPGAPWFEVLIRLRRTPGNRLRMADLAAQTTLTPSGLTRAVDRLVHLGLVSREACADDRRGAYAALTTEGERVMDDALPRHADAVRELLGGVLPLEEQLTLAAILRKLRDHVNPGAAALSRD